MHPILDSLNGSQHEWLKKLLLTFNEGNIGKFEALAPLFPKEVSSFNFPLLHLTIYRPSPLSKRTTTFCARRFV